MKLVKKYFMSAMPPHEAVTTSMIVTIESYDADSLD